MKKGICDYVVEKTSEGRMMAARPDNGKNGEGWWKDQKKRSPWLHSYLLGERKGFQGQDACNNSGAMYAEMNVCARLTWFVITKCGSTIGYVFLQTEKKKYFIQVPKYHW